MIKKKIKKKTQFHFVKQPPPVSYIFTLFALFFLGKIQFEPFS